MENWEVAAALERMAGLLALKGEDSFKIRAYSQAARQIVRLSEPLAQIIAEDRLEQIPGIGKALSSKIKELVATGQSSFLARLEKEVPPELLTLFSIPGVGFRTAGKLVQELKLENLAQLEEAARQGKVAELPAGEGAAGQGAPLLRSPCRRAGALPPRRGPAPAEQLHSFSCSCLLSCAALPPVR